MLLGIGCTGKSNLDLDDTGEEKEKEACESEIVTPVDASRLSESAGCGDFIFFSLTQASDLLLYFYVNGPVARANEELATVSSAYTLPHPDVTLNLQVGSNLFSTVCTDDLNGEAELTHLYAASSGQVSLTVTPDLDDTAAWGRGGSVDLSLSGMGFVDESGCDIALPTMIVSGIEGGVFPGG